MDPIAKAAIFLKIGDHQNALAYTRMALEADNKNYLAWSLAGDTLGRMGQRSKAMNAFEMSVRCNPEFAKSNYELGNLLQKRNNLADGHEYLQQAVNAEPHVPEYLSALILSFQKQCEWNHIPKLIERLENIILTPGYATHPYNLLTTDLPPHLIVKATDHFQRLLCEKYDSLPKAHIHRKYSKGDKIRVAYLSSDFRNHVCGTLVSPLFEYADHDNFHVMAIAGCIGDNSMFDMFVRCCADEYIVLAGYNLPKDQARVAALQPDILVDLNGLTAMNRLDVVASRPAPIVINYLGYPGTISGLFYDHILVDHFLVEREDLLLEKPLYLNQCYQINPNIRPMAKRPETREAHNLSDEAVVYACFATPHKITERMFRTWCNILRAVPNSVLWLCSHNETSANNLRKQADKHNIDPKRIVFTETTEYATYLRKLKLADIYLSTYPYSAGAMAADAMWCEVPVVCMVGDLYSSRMAGSLNYHFGSHMLVCETFQEYTDMAIEMGLYATALENEKRKLRLFRTANHSFNPQKFMSELEEKYKNLMEEYCE